jgi:ABC-type glycerol-3-phosphate transport system substrate-binding protein
VQGTVALIPAHGHQKDLAAQLLAWMESPEILAEEMYTNYNLPTSKTAAQDPRFQSDPNFKVFLNLMADPNATYLITTPINQEFNNEYGTIEEQVLHAGTDPKPLLDAAQAKLVPLLEEALK